MAEIVEINTTLKEMQDSLVNFRHNLETVSKNITSLMTQGLLPETLESRMASTGIGKNKSSYTKKNDSFAISDSEEPLFFDSTTNITRKNRPSKGGLGRYGRGWDTGVI